MGISYETAASMLLGQATMQSSVALVLVDMTYLLP